MVESSVQSILVIRKKHVVEIHGMDKIDARSPKKGRSVVLRWHLRPYFQSYKTPKFFEFIGLDSVAVKWQSPHHSSVLRFNLKSSHEITNNDIIRKTKYQSSNTPKFARKLLTLQPLHLILAMKPIQWAPMPSVRKPTSGKIKNTPMNCKPNRENIGLWSNSSTRYIWVVSNVLVRIAHAYLPVQWNPTALLPQGSTTGVRCTISTHYIKLANMHPGHSRLLQSEQDCIYAHLQCSLEHHLTCTIRSFGGGCVHNTTPSCRDQLASECKPELGEISAPISLMKTDFKFSSK